MTLTRPPRLGDGMIIDRHGHDTRGPAVGERGLDIDGLRARLEALGVEDVE